MIKRIGAHILLVAVVMAIVLGALCGSRTYAYAEMRLPSDEAESECPLHIDISLGSKVFSYVEKSIVPTDFTVAEEISARLINAPRSQKIELIDLCLKKGADYKTALLTCYPLLERTVDKVREAAYVPPIDSRVEYRNGKFFATEEKFGAALDEDRLYASIYYAVRYGLDERITAVTKKISPKTFKSELGKNLTLRGEYETDFSTSKAARAHNVTLALSKFDGVCIAPGETLSFNEKVGERSESNGFRYAKIILDGKYVDGVGGGVCQASTAIYNAAMVAGLKATANAHSICPSYCPPGLDAMISETSDLKITNTTENPVFISVKTSEGKARVAVFGAPSEYSYLPESVIKRTIPRDVIDDSDGESRLMISPGCDGYESATYINIMRDGQLVKRVLIRENVYKSSPRIFTGVQPR